MSSEGSPSLFDEINPTPELTESPGRFTISYEDVEQELPLGLSDAYHLNQHREPFLASLARPESQTDGNKSMSALL